MIVEGEERLDKERACYNVNGPIWVKYDHVYNKFLNILSNRFLDITYRLYSKFVLFGSRVITSSMA
jgi:predicted component of type VI protein secretion system